MLVAVLQIVAKSTAMRPCSKSTHFTVSFVRMRHSVGLYSALFPFHRLSVPLGDDRRAIKKLFLVHRLGKHLGELSLLWSPYVVGQTIIFSSCFFFLLLSSFFLFFPRLISAVGDWMFTILWHMVWP